MEPKESIHPAGEGELSFSTYAGKVGVGASTEALTPFGGFVPWAAFMKESGIFERLSESCPVRRTSPNASKPFDILCSFALTALCEGTRFNHVNRLRHDPVLAELFGMERIVSDDTIRRFFRLFDQRGAREWIDAASTRLWKSIPENYILDWDSTVITRFGKQEQAEVGYNPQKRGRASHHPLLAVVAGTRLCPYYRLRSGKSSSAGEWTEAMEECFSAMGRKPWLNRADIGFASEKIMAWHESSADRPRYLFKLKLTGNVKRAIASIGEEGWQGVPRQGVLQLSEVEGLELHGWSKARRVILGRRLQSESLPGENGEFWKRAKHEYEAYVTDLDQEEANAWQIVELYRKRADCENVFDELKNQWGLAGFCSRNARVTSLASKLQLLVYNMWNLFMRLLEPQRHVEAAHGRRWFLFIAARLCKSSRQRECKLSVSPQWWKDLEKGYIRVANWLALTAPQLKSIPPPAANPQSPKAIETQA